MALEEEFKLEIPDKEADKIDSCNLAIEYIHNHPLASWFEHMVSLPEFRGRQWHSVLFVFLVQCLYGFDPHAGIGNNLSLFDKSSIGRTAIWLHYASSTKWSLVSICEEVLNGTKFLFTFRMLQFPAAAFVHGFHCVVHCYFGGYLSLARDFSDACILFSRSACFTLCFLVCRFKCWSWHTLFSCCCFDCLPLLFEFMNPKFFPLPCMIGLQGLVSWCIVLEEK